MSEDELQDLVLEAAAGDAEEPRLADRVSVGSHDHD
jgi:hypothetical protein